MDLPDKKRPERSGPTQDIAQEATARKSPLDVSTEFFPNAAIVRAGLESARIGVWSWDAD